MDTPFDHESLIEIIEAFWNSNRKGFDTMEDIQEYFKHRDNTIHTTYFINDDWYMSKIQLIDTDESWIYIRLAIDKNVYNGSGNNNTWIVLPFKYQKDFIGLSEWFSGYSCTIFYNYYSFKIKLFNNNIEQRNVMIIFKPDFPDNSHEDREKTFILR